MSVRDNRKAPVRSERAIGKRSSGEQSTHEGTVPEHRSPEEEGKGGVRGKASHEEIAPPEDEALASVFCTGQSSLAEEPAPEEERGVDLGDEVLVAFFSDETEAFRTPAQPDPGEVAVVRMRVDACMEANVLLLMSGATEPVEMKCVRSDELFDWYEASIPCGDEPITYRFIIEYCDREIVYQKTGACWHDRASAPNPLLDFRIVPGFRTPAWAQGAVMYQIFPDRFANGNPENDVRTGEYAYDNAPVEHVDDWSAFPLEDDYRRFYGGDLQGIVSKLDYLQSIGVEAIYLNPIFVSPSSHGYDTQDYEHVDPHFAIICDDTDQLLPQGSVSNADARAYIRRTTSRENLERSNEYFAEFCRELHSRGMRIILDGVFNHCGSFSQWMNGEGIYEEKRGYEKGAAQDPDSQYRTYFCFDEALPNGYESWWGFPTLPKLNYEGSPELCDAIVNIARKWAMPPYSIDGWRLDVAADLGHSVRFNHMFWQRFRAELKKVNPELLILAEHYGDPSPWLRGDEWDTVMNYDAFMEPLTYFLTGMEKHSDSTREDLYQNGAAFVGSMQECMARFDWPSLLCAMNELSNHDHSRFLTRTNRRVGRSGWAGPHAAGEGVDKRVMREAVVVQMTWPGAPTIYYGDEAGQLGWTDPDCRRTFPWGNEDWGLVELHRGLVALRKEHPCLRSGSLASFGGGGGWIAFGRFLGEDRVVTVCNNADYEQVVKLRLRSLGATDGAHVVQLLRTTAGGFRTERVDVGVVEDGYIEARLSARSALVASCG